jgi:flagellar P-ring protein precursor FlgI
VQDAVNTHFRGFFAKSNDPASVELTVPLLYKDKPVEFVAKVESLTVVIDKKAIVMVNERTGTVVMGAEVHILPVSVAHGDLAIDIGKAAKDKAPAKAVVNLPGSTVGELIETLNAMGAKPSDLTGILQAVHAAGALQAELKFM